MEALRVLSVVGMHRSGTSLAARYLHESGLFMGHDMLGKHWSNPGGHFEDKEFVSLHNSILKAHHVDFAVTSQIDWKYEEAFVGRAREILEARNSFSKWGWKDPRTALFLPFWKKLIPGCHFVVVYRHYLPVVRSLISRDILLDRTKTSRWQRMMHPRYTRETMIDLFEKYLRTWIWYYKEIITHIIKDPNMKYHFVTYDQMAGGDFSTLLGLQHHGFELSPPRQFNKKARRAPFIMDIPALAPESLLLEADNVHKYMSNFEGLHE